MTFVSPLRAFSDARAQQWSENVDITVGVGTRHHVVPSFYLRRFASEGGQLWVRDRQTGQGRAQSYKDLAVRDFYTVVNDEGEKDGSMEQVLCMLEDETAKLFKRLLSNFRAEVPLSIDDRFTLSTFVAMQNVRGMRTRRQNELLTDYHVKLMARGTKHERLLAGLTAVPHPNEHIRLFGTSQVVAEELMRRPVVRLTLDAPLLLTCDEPVLVINDGHVRHRPECFLTAKQRRVRQRKDRQAKRVSRELLHFYPTKPSGIAMAEGIVLPVSPTTMIVFGRPGQDLPPYVDLAGEEAVDAAAEVNQRVIDQAFSWIAAHVDHATARTCDLPPVGPILNVCDGGTPMSRELQAPPSPWMPSILGRP